MQFNKYAHTHTIPPREDQCEWHRMTRMTGPDCAVMCNLINTHTYRKNRLTHSRGDNWKTSGPEVGAVLGSDQKVVFRHPKRQIFDIKILLISLFTSAILRAKASFYLRTRYQIRITHGRPGEPVGNLETFGHVGTGVRIAFIGIFPHKKKGKKKKKCPTCGERLLNR